MSVSNHLSFPILIVSISGINTVRMPLAYWHLGPTFIQGTAFEPYATIYANAWERIVNAVNQAGKHGLGVLIDFSGPVGSSVPLPPALTTGNQTYFNGTGNMDRTVAALTYLTDQFAHVTNVVGIELLDNPDLKADLETFCGSLRIPCVFIAKFGNRRSRPGYPSKVVPQRCHLSLLHSRRVRFGSFHHLYCQPYRFRRRGSSCLFVCPTMVSSNSH